MSEEQKGWLEARREAGGFARTSDVVRELMRSRQPLALADMLARFAQPESDGADGVEPVETLLATVKRVKQDRRAYTARSFGQFCGSGGHWLARGRCPEVLKLIAAGGFESWRTPWITAEWSDTAQRVAETEKRWRNSNWLNWLALLKAVSKMAEDIPVRQTVLRDPNDDPVIMAGVAVRAAYIVSYDPDLPDLQKPHGTACVTPRAFLSVISRSQ